MIKSIVGNIMKTECHKCGKEKEINLDGVVITKNEFDEWENFVVECECGSGVVYNLNIPEDDTDEPFETGDLPVEEEIQRHYVRILQRMVREDFVNKRIKGGDYNEHH